ncbi:MAG TPA: UDP-N-acetylmuramoyl-tripeptide--D-alanyl-D-alanine ligase [Candidatus Paceibacterota bacterium]|nr:UDP-N-acetylmuramoyl-tripeptide--D-alanyl-D-alanine ligase [Candidatus Paceibacterota bacterium]
MKSALKSIVVSILTAEARLALSRRKPKIIAVTGNVGKTSTKDAIAAVLIEAYGADAVRKSEKSLNSEIGLPLAILGLETAWSSAAGWLRNIRLGFRAALSKDSIPEWLVLEVGADHPGDIESVTRWLKPDIAVLTRMSDIPVHVEFFKDASEVLREKMFLAKALKPGGTLVVNANDPHFVDPVKTIEANKVFYGAKKGMAAEIVESEIMYDNGPLGLPTGQSAVIRIGNNEARIELPGVLGSHLVYPIAASCAVAAVLGIESSVKKAFRNFETPKGRMRIIDGINTSAIIDDTYNSSPLACKEALRAVGVLSTRGRKIAALGDMKELGSNTEAAHRDVGVLAAETLHTLVTVGEAAKFIAAGARSAGMAADRILSFDDSLAAADALHDFVRAGDVVLVKGSQSMRMERVSKALLAKPEQAPDLLVRQDEEWLKR